MTNLTATTNHDLSHLFHVVEEMENAKREASLLAEQCASLGMHTAEALWASHGLLGSKYPDFQYEITCTVISYYKNAQ